MKTNKWILGGLMAMAITACTSDELVENTNPTQGKKVTVTAYAPGDEANSRVSFDDDNTSKVTLSWKDSESFSVVYNTSVGTFSKSEEGNTFTGVLPYDEENWQDSYYAVYPALSVNTSLTSANTVPFDLSTQTGALDESKTYMRASSSNGLSYSFQHCTAILKATFANIPAGAKISQVVVKTSHADSKVDGNLDLATGAITGGSMNTITIDYTTAVDASTPVYIYLPPMAAEKKALAFEVSTTDDKTYTGTLGAPNTPEPSDGESSNANQGQGIVAGKLYTATIALTEVIPYVTFRAASTQTLDLVQTESQMLDEGGNPVYEDDEETIPVLVPNPYPGYGGDTGYIEYSVGNSNEWTKFTPESQPVEFGGDKGDLHLRGISPKGTLKAQIVFGNNTTPVACSGDIRTLVDWEDYETAVTSSAIFRGLFKDCSVLTSAPELPATTLAEHCYDSMFAGCTNLAAAPELPATTLAPYCYKSMFYDCTSLTEAPELPATTLANQCYGMMFHGCASLNAAPELPATTLAADCYNGMFADCISLTAAPELLATTLAGSCCISMFKGCTSLISAPALLATTLVTGCYYDMFRGCTSLNSVTMLATDISAENCLTDWMSGVPAGGTFTKAASLEQGTESGKIPTGVSGIPSGWTVKNYGEPEN